MKMVLITEKRLDELFERTIEDINKRLLDKSMPSEPDRVVTYHMVNLKNELKDGPLGT